MAQWDGLFDATKNVTFSVQHAKGWTFHDKKNIYGTNVIVN